MNRGSKILCRSWVSRTVLALNECASVGFFLQAHVRRHRKAKCHYLVWHSKHLDASCFPFGFAMLKALQAGESGSLAYCFWWCLSRRLSALWRVSRLGDTPTSAWRVEWKDWLEQRMPWEQQQSDVIWRDVSHEGLNVLKSEIHVVFLPKRIHAQKLHWLLVEQFLCCIPKNFKGFQSLSNVGSANIRFQLQDYRMYPAWCLCGAWLVGRMKFAN